jgi:hypothetical protein
LKIKYFNWILGEKETTTKKYKSYVQSKTIQEYLNESDGDDEAVEHARGGGGGEKMPSSDKMLKPGKRFIDEKLLI